jgi:uncharacterized protein YyaL (SSP411 family)
MEHESFEDQSVASLMNAHYLSIKVDREERPDIDARYMAAVQLMTGQGGWPLNCVALPDGTPIWGGTYFSKQDWTAALTQIAQLWQDQPDELLSYGQKLRDGLKEMVSISLESGKSTFSDDDLQDVMMPWKKSLDHRWGGGLQAPKFPMPSNINFLLNYSLVYKDWDLRKYVFLTLERMSYGGLFDVLHGGFTRYSTDRFWKVPHFEKMLYDNAQLLQTFARAHRTKPSSHFKEVIENTLRFLNAQMKLDCGLFGAALDADSKTPESDREEGGYYTWTSRELNALGLLQDERFCSYFDIGPYSTWEGKYILHRPFSDEEFCAEHAIENAWLQEKKKHWTRILSTAALDRESSHHKPQLDPKAITAWNSLLIVGMAESHWALPRSGFDQQALALMDRMIELVWNGEQLSHQYIKTPEGLGFLDDYATFGDALLTAYSLSGMEKYLTLSLRIKERIEQLFPVHPTSGLRPYSQEKLETWQQHFEIEDNVIPSANALCALFFSKLSSITGVSNAVLNTQLSTLYRKVFKQGPHFSLWLDIALAQLKHRKEWVVCGVDAKNNLEAFLTLLDPRRQSLGTL